MSNELIDRISCFLGFHEWQDWYFHYLDPSTGAGMQSLEKTTCAKCRKRMDDYEHEHE